MSRPAVNFSSRSALTCFCVLLASGCSPLVEGRLDHHKGNTGHTNESSHADGGDLSDAGEGNTHDSGSATQGHMDGGPDMDAGPQRKPDGGGDGDQGDGDHGDGDHGDGDHGDGDHGDGDGGDGDAQVPAQVHCIAHAAFAGDTCNSNPCAEPSSCPATYNTSYCPRDCAHDTTCAADVRPLAMCTRDNPVNASEELEVQVSHGAPLFADDMSVHFSTHFDSVISRKSKIVIDGDGFSVELDHPGWPFWARDTARAFAPSCVTVGSCTAPVSVKNWAGCYQHCAGVPTMQVWSFTPQNENSGTCSCSEGVGTAVAPVVGARSGRMRDVAVTFPADADPVMPSSSRYGGDDYSSFGATPEKCSGLCQDAATSVPRCLSWAVVTNSQTGFQRCYLKGDRAAIALSYPAPSGFSSGASAAGVLVETTLANQMDHNWDHVGGDYHKEENIYSWDACNDLCAADFKCIGWSFSKDHNLCFLKDESVVGSKNLATESAMTPGLTVVVRHAYADGQVDEVALRTGLSSFFDGALTIVRDAAKHTYQLYVDGAAVGAAQTYAHEPLAMPAVMRVAKISDGVPVSADYAPVSELSFFDRALDADGVKALLLLRDPLPATP